MLVCAFAGKSNEVDREGCGHDAEAEPGPDVGGSNECDASREEQERAAENNDRKYSSCSAGKQRFLHMLFHYHTILPHTTVHCVFFVTYTNSQHNYKYTLYTYTLCIQAYLTSVRFSTTQICTCE